MCDTCLMYNAVNMFQEDFIAAPPPEALAPRLLHWFDLHKRDLPWRHTRDPYHIWVSEIMLQQTQVVTVIPYYERFLQAFPTVQALATAPLDDVLRLWEGLGYYSRARNLQRAAQLVVADFGGRFPDTLAAALSLPGIGRYTAGAVLSIAFGLPLPALDGNALRVLSRIFWLPGGGRQGEEKRRADEIGHAAVPSERSGDYTQALMELGATVCAPKAPRCEACPLNQLCLAWLRGEPDAIPVIQRAPAQSVAMVAGIIRRGNRLLIARRPEQGVWAGLWEFPNVEVSSALAAPGTPDTPVGHSLAVYVQQAFGLKIQSAESLTTVSHGIMNRRITLTVHECHVISGRLRCRWHDEARWVRVGELPEYALPAPHRKIARRLQ